MEKYYLDEEGLKRLIKYIAEQLESRDQTIEQLNNKIKANNLLDADIIVYGGSASDVLPEEG